MTLDVLENQYRIELADEDFFNSLSKSSIKFANTKLVYEYFNGNFTQISNVDIQIFIF